MNISRSLLCLAALLLLLPAHAKDIKGSKDHPLIKRYEGSSIFYYNVADFDAYEIITGKVTTWYSAVDAVNPNNSLALEGKVTRINYSHPPGRSTLEVLRNYEQELKGAGFTILFECDKDKCGKDGGRHFGLVMAGQNYARSGNHFSELKKDQRYLAAKKARPEGDVYVSLYVVRQYNVSGPTENTINIALAVIETKPIENRLMAGATHPEDFKGGKDHPLVKRYSGARITYFHYTGFDEYRLVTGSITKASHDPAAVNDTNSIHLEGKVTRINYSHPPGRAPLEVLRNYEQAFKADGYQILFQCRNNQCGAREFGSVMASENYARSYMDFGEKWNDQHYLVARLARPQEGDVYVSLFVVRNYNTGGKNKDAVNFALTVVEVKPMESRMVLVKADEMKQAIAETGRVSIYGIYFDFDKADVKPESQPTLQEISKLLNDDPALNLTLEGHTDNQGTDQYNLDLSDRRAQAVVRTLVADYGIDQARLAPVGKGESEPVASNDTEQGRAKNRRVDLVKRESTQMSAPAPAPTPPSEPATPAVPSPASGNSDIKQSLQKLKELHEQGLITDDEYKSKKQEILDRL